MLRYNLLSILGICMSIYYFEHYKNYMQESLKTIGASRGRRLKLAEHLDCKPGYISQVINGHTDFSQEHGIKTCEFLGLSEDEQHYFMLLLQKERAGSMLLKKYFKKEITKIRNLKQQVKEQLLTYKTLNNQDKVRYYGQWYYSAIHILVSIPGFQTKDKVAKKLNLSLSVVGTALEFLESTGLVIQKKNRYIIGETRIHLEPNSPMITKHHTNWRLEAIKSLEKDQPNSLHYSSVVSISEEDFNKIKNILLDSIKKTETVLPDSKEEELCSLNIDFFAY